jgi:ABC-type glycerol-3-phosphate transport system permease component
MILNTDRRTTVIVQVVTGIAALFFIAPMLVAVSVALRGNGLDNFVTVLSDPHLLRFLLNSLGVVIGTIVLVLFSSTLAAYAFVILPIRWGGGLLLLIVAPMMIPPASIFLPLFIDMRALGLLNTLPAVIGPVAALTIPIMMLMIRSYLFGVPRAIVDASRVDGCNSFQTLALVVLPMMRPILVVVTIWTFLAAWNEYFLPLIFLRKIESQVISLSPKFFVVDEMTPNLGLQFAALLLISIPTLALFLAFRRQLMNPVTYGAVK